MIFSKTKLSVVLEEEDSETSSSSLIELKRSTNSAWKSLGFKEFSRAKKEKQNKVFRRSIYFIKPLKKGSIVSKYDIKRISPGFGLPPKFEEQIIGMELNKNVERGDPVSWEDFKK